MKRYNFVARIILVTSLALSVVLVACTTPNTPDGVDEVPRVSIEYLLQKIESRADILIIDNRGEASYNAEHIKGAVWIKTSEILGGLWEAPAGKELILY
jgi:hypothetical protein